MDLTELGNGTGENTVVNADTQGTNTPVEEKEENKDTFELKEPDMVEVPETELDNVSFDLDDLDYDYIESNTDSETPNISQEDIDNLLSDDELDKALDSWNEVDNITGGAFDLGEQNVIPPKTNETVDMGPQSENENGYVKDYDTVELNSNYNDVTEKENSESIPTDEPIENNAITEQDIISQTGERPTEQEVQTINEVATKDKDNEIELKQDIDPNTVADTLNNLEDNGSDITSEEVQTEQSDDNGDSKIVKEAIQNKGMSLLSDEDMDKFIQQAEADEEYKKNTFADDGYPTDIDNRLTDNVWNSREEAIEQLPDNWTEDKVELKVGKDQDGYFWYAVPNSEEQYKLDTLNSAQTKTGEQMTRDEAKSLYQSLNKEAKEKEEAAKLKNWSDDEVEKQYKNYTPPTQEEWEASYNNGTRGQLSRQCAEHTRIAKEYSLRDYCRKHNIDLNSDEGLALRDELLSSGKKTALEERYGDEVKGYKTGSNRKTVIVSRTDYNKRLDLAHQKFLREKLEQEKLSAAQKAKIEQEVENIDKEYNEDINVDTVYVKDSEGNLTEAETELVELTPEEIELLGGTDKYTQFNPDTDILMKDSEGNVVVATSENGTNFEEIKFNTEPNIPEHLDDGEYSDKETYMTRDRLPSWDNFRRWCKPNEWQELGVDRSEYEDVLTMEATIQAEKLGYKPDEYSVDIEYNDNGDPVSVEIIPEKRQKNKRVHFLKHLKETTGPNIEGELTEGTETKVDNNSVGAGHISLDNSNYVSASSGNVSNSVSNVSKLGGGNVSNTDTKFDMNTKTNTAPKLSGKTTTVSQTVTPPSKFSLQGNRTAASKAVDKVKSTETKQTSNRERTSNTDIKSKYRKSGSRTNSKQLGLSLVHNDNSMISIIDKITAAVNQSYHNWSKSGGYYYFNGNEGKVRYKIGGNIEIKFKGETNWQSLKTISRRTGISEQLQKLLDELQRG